MKYLSLAYEHPENLSLWTNPEKTNEYVLMVMEISEKNIAG